MIFVSHDRYFIDRLATRVIEVENGAITTYEGNYEDYLRRKEALAASTANTTDASARANNRTLRPSSANGSIKARLLSQRKAAIRIRA